MESMAARRDRSRALRFTVVTAGAGLVALSTATVVLGVVHAAVGLAPRWDLDAERTPAAWWSSALLVLAAALGGVLALRVRRMRVVLALSALFFLMGLDEVGRIHERVEGRFDIDWQVAYLPVFAVAGVAWIIVWSRTREVPIARRWLAGGAVC